MRTYTIETGMSEIIGHSNELNFLTSDEILEFNVIGYTGKNSKGISCSYSEYLNSLGKGEFSVKQTKFDNGDFHEKYLISRYIVDDNIKKEVNIKPLVYVKYDDHISCKLNGQSLLDIYTVYNNEKADYYYIGFGFIIPRTITEVIPYIEYGENHFKTLEEAKNKCEEIVEKFVLFFIK